MVGEPGCISSRSTWLRFILHPSSFSSGPKFLQNARGRISLL
jgi:hypothetical protein